MRIQNPYVKRKARIEIIPLIDIIFFLLATFVMVSLSMIKNEGVPVKLPAASSAVPQERNNSLTISVTRAGEIYLEKKQVAAADLKEQIAFWKARQTDPQIFIHGDEQTPFKNLMQVLDTVRMLGISKVSMQTRPNTEGNPI